MRSFLLAFIIFIFFITPVKAVRSLIISSGKNSLNAGEELEVDASASGFASSEAVFVKGAFYKEGETNYFGLTKAGDNWVKNSDPAEIQPRVVVDVWDGKLILKSDFSDSGFKGSGNYKLKVGFYYTTSGGNLSSVNWSSNVLDISLVAPSPSPSPTPTPSPTATPQPTASPQKTLIPIVTPSPKAVLKTPTPGPLTPEPVETLTPEPQVLGAQEIIQTPIPTPLKSNFEFDKSKIFAFVLIFAGVSFIIPAVYFATHASN